jgi:hypothetical protein
MISGNDLYSVLSAVVPLYVAMMLAYGSVKWWGILTPQQCGGINRFVSIFAVPLLSFQFISGNNPYAMNFRPHLSGNLGAVLKTGQPGLDDHHLRLEHHPQHARDGNSPAGRYVWC